MVHIYTCINTHTHTHTRADKHTENTDKHTQNNAETMLCVTADIWQQRCGRIDSVNSCLRKVSSRPVVKVIQAAAGTFSYISCHSEGM